MRLKMPNYTKNGKILVTVDDTKFFDSVKKNEKNLGKDYTAFVVLLYYFGIRVSEGLKLKREAFTISKGKLYVDIGERLKHSKRTAPVSVMLDRPYVSWIIDCAKNTERKQRVWKFSRVTAWRIVSKHFRCYPHFYRLNRITTFFDKNFPISKVKNWTGLTLSSLNYYCGISDTEEMGESI